MQDGLPGTQEPSLGLMAGSREFKSDSTDSKVCLAPLFAEDIQLRMSCFLLQDTLSAP